MAGEVKQGELDERRYFAALEDDSDLPVALAELPRHPLAVSAPAGSAFVASRARLLLANAVNSISQSLAIEKARGTPFLFAPVFLGAGAVTYFARESEQALLPLLILLALLALGVFLAVNHPVLRGVLIACSLANSGMVAAKFETMRQNSVLLGEQISTRVTGRILSIEDIPRGQKALIEVIDTERPKLKYQPDRIRVTLRKAPYDLKAGDGVKALFLLHAPSGPVRPGSYDFAFDNYFDRIGATGVSIGPVEIKEIAAAGLVQRVDARIDRARRYLARRILRTVDGQSGEVSAALIAGVGGGIDGKTYDDMRVTGLAHVLSISGLHMALVAGTVMGFIRLLLAAFPHFSSRYPTKKIAALCALAASLLYLMLSGGGVATVRSFIMLAVMLIAICFDRAALTLRNLAISAVLIILVTPHEIMGPSFQMSFAATAALVGVYQIWGERQRAGSAEFRSLPLWHRALRFGFKFFLGLAATSIIAGIATSLYSAFHFNRIAPMGLFANLAAMPAVSLIVMPMAVLAMLLMPFGLEAYPLWLMGKGVDIMLSVAEYFAARSPAGATGLVPSGALVLLTIALVVISLPATRLRWVAIVPALAGLVLIGTRQMPEMIVSSDARLVAVRGADGALHVNRDRPNVFSVENWQRAYLAGDVIKPADPRAGANGFACDEGFCLYVRDDGTRIGYVSEIASFGAACRQSDVLVAAFPLFRRSCRNENARLITARELARRGAAEVFASTAPVPAFDIRYSYSGTDRPWQRHRIFSRAARDKAPYASKPKPAKTPEHFTIRQPLT